MATPTPISVISGLPIVILGEAIRTWSSGYIRKNKQLATDGPYAYTRNPLYLGSFLIGFGFIVMARNPYVLISFLMGFAVIYQAVVLLEETKLEMTFGKKYQDYCGHVPRFIPRLRRHPYGAGLFEWSLVQKHREYLAWLGMAGGMMILFLKTGI